MNETLWKRKDCVSAEVEGALVLLDLETLVYHSLNATATAVWQLLEHPATKRSLIEAMCAQYEVPVEQCTISVEKLLATLSASNLVAGVASAA